MLKNVNVKATKGKFPLAPYKTLQLPLDMNPPPEGSFLFAFDWFYELFILQNNKSIWAHEKKNAFFTSSEDTLMVVPTARLKITSDVLEDDG